ncbi:hypothetical protein PINS_up008368 [Pythium insidiosum]|nr:hypothetical protein PINS_up008368 [Pythium insidiosum]
MTAAAKKSSAATSPERAPLLQKTKATSGTSSSKQPRVRREPPVDVRGEFLQLLNMALQVSLSTFARIALTSIDSAFLGHLGTSALAASSLAGVWTNVPLSAVWAGASALITLCGQAWGARNGELTGIWLQMGPRHRLDPRRARVRLVLEHWRRAARLDDGRGGRAPRHPLRAHPVVLDLAGAHLRLRAALLPVHGHHGAHDGGRHCLDWRRMRRQLPAHLRRVRLGRPRL